MKNISHKTKLWQYKLHINTNDVDLLQINLLTLIYELKKNLNFLKISKLVCLPSKRKKFSILRSPFVDNSSRESLELRSWKTLIIFQIKDSRNRINKVIQRLFENALINVLKNQQIKISYTSRKSIY